MTAAGDRAPSTDERRKAWISYGLVVAAIPTAWAAELALRATFLAGRTRAIEDLFGPTLDRLAWIGLWLTVALGLLAAALRPALRRRYAPGAAMMAGASIAQAPAILVCAVGMLGAAALPVGLTVAVSTVLVAWHTPVSLLS